MKRDKLVEFIKKTVGKELLEKAAKVDTRANGVQIHGKDEIKKVVLGVSANLDFFKEAVKAGADFCIFHHGLSFVNNQLNQRLNPAIQKRLKIIFDNNLTVAGYHYCLDAHPTIGNNAVIIKKLGARRLNEPYFELEGAAWGWIAEFNKTQDVKKLAEKCSEVFSHDVFAVYAGSKKVKRIGVCSGGAKPYKESLFEVIDKKIELHISGEIVEGSSSLAKEIGFNYFACGHYATEVFGVQELGLKIKKAFPQLKVEFIDIPNPL